VVVWLVLVVLFGRTGIGLVLMEDRDLRCVSVLANVPYKSRTTARRRLIFWV